MRRRLPFLAHLLALGLLLASCGNEPTPYASNDLPEHWFTYPISHILIQSKDREPGEAVRKALEVMDELKSGRPFEEVARRQSENPNTAPRGGFLGFFRLQGNEFSGAVQALQPGAVSGPIDTEQGLHILKRHTFEEGRALEQRYTIPAYGFLLPFENPEHPEKALPKEEAKRRAEEAVAKIRAGELTIGDAARAYTPELPPTPDAFIGNIAAQGSSKELFEALTKLEVGQVAAPFVIQGVYWVLKRGAYYRCMVRHILIQHVGAEDRPLSIRRTRTEAEALAKRVLAETKRDGSNWMEVLRKYSDDHSTIGLMGSIGSGGQEDFIYEMREVLEKTPPGRVADDIADTSRGFHVLWRMN